MANWPVPADESARLEALRSYSILDSESDENFDRITRLASQVLDFEDVIRLDLRYQENWSLGYDLQLIVRTFTVIFSKGSGAA
jgi:lipopolysaccharide/colanic/teichoic acid biosynthesis glycosyltransferase